MPLNEIITETPEAGENRQTAEIRLATVAEVLEDGLRLQFDGSDEATSKVYKCNTSCIFVVGDRVKVTKQSGTYLVDYVIGAPGSGGSGNIPAGGSSGQVLAKSSSADYAIEWRTPHYVPSGGTSGQVLAKSSDDNYSLAWSTPHYVPSGGASGQVLAKSSGDAYEVNWVDAHGIPTGGTSGQVLAKSSNSNYAVSWVDAHGIPTGGTSGQVLAKSSNSNYAVSWVDVSAAKLKSGTNEVALSGSVLTPSVGSSIALGSASKPFGDLHASGAISLGANYKAINIGTVSSTLGFFGHAAASRQTVSNTASVATLITALKAYGLIS